MSETRRFLLPDLGEGLTEAEVVAWHVAPGDVVGLNQVLLEVETEKATVELPSPCAGTVVELLAAAGETVAVGAGLVALETEDRPGRPVEDASPRPAEGAARVPMLVGYGPATARPSRRRRRGGARPHQGAPTEAPRPPAATPTEAGRPLAAPPVRFMARQHGIDLTAVTGTGRDGVITREDLAAHLVAGTDAGARPMTDDTGGAERSGRETRHVPRGVRKHMAEAMVRSVATAPQACVFLTVDATATTELVAHLRAGPHFEGTRVTPLTVAARATVLALQASPALNASWDEATGEVVTKHDVNLGIAVAGPKGLIVPSIKQAQDLSFRQLAAALDALTTRARAGLSTPAELRGGTATITNIGVFGVDAGVPVLNPGEAAIVALGAVQRRPWAHEGAVALRDVVTLSVAFDHRLADGEQASRFLATLGEMLADPTALLAYA
ncbi:MAG TPA: dihydrolipoamide acetyltransferase family protein [Acidimicrobiales bacterium]|nr:dihydrolipoamide acetyltransferase family protein [Acidimicrobiales bacterium]